MKSAVKQKVLKKEYKEDFFFDLEQEKKNLAIIYKDLLNKVNKTFK